MAFQLKPSPGAVPAPVPCPVVSPGGCCAASVLPTLQPDPHQEYPERWLEKMQCLSVCLSLKSAPLRSADGVAKEAVPTAAALTVVDGWAVFLLPRPPVQGDCPFGVEQVDRSGPRRGRG